MVKKQGVKEEQVTKKRKVPKKKSVRRTPSGTQNIVETTYIINYKQL